MVKSFIFCFTMHYINGHLRKPMKIGGTSTIDKSYGSGNLPGKDGQNYATGPPFHEHDLPIDYRMCGIP